MRDGDGAAIESFEAVMRAGLEEGRFECDAEHDEACLLCEAHAGGITNDSLRGWLDARWLGEVHSVLRRRRALSVVQAALASRADVPPGSLATAVAFLAPLEVIEFLLARTEATTPNMFAQTPFQRTQPEPNVRPASLGLKASEAVYLGKKASVARARLFEALRQRVGPIAASQHEADDAVFWLLTGASLPLLEAFVRLCPSMATRPRILQLAMATYLTENSTAQLAFIEWLLSHGADANATIAKAPILLTVIGPSEPAPDAARIARMFIAAGADTSQRDAHGFTACDWACYWRLLELAELLGHPTGASLASACDPRAPDEQRLEVARWALNHGVGTEYQSRWFFNETPLVMACRTGDADLVRLLLAHGANTSATDRQGVTAEALMAARSHGREPPR